jgi:hypothetical protein
MKLKLASLDGLPQGLAQFAKQNEGVFDLETPDTYVFEDITPLKTKRDELLADLKEHKQRLEAFKDIDPVAYKQQLQELAELKARPNKGSADAVAEAKAQLEQTYKQKVTDLEAKVAHARSRERDYVLAQAEADALRSDKFKAKTGLELMLRSQATVIEEDGKFIPVVLNTKTGKPRISHAENAEGQYMTLRELAEEMHKDKGMSHFFESSGMQGSGVSGKTAGWAGENPFLTGNLTEQLTLRASKPELAAQLQAQAQAQSASAGRPA